MKKLKLVLLVDDDQITNTLNSMVIKKTGLAENIETAINGEDALEYISGKRTNGELPMPDLILLDINMPRMNGWEFLEEYKKLDDTIRKSIIVMMLTSSLNKDDERKSKQINLIKGFERKPLTVESFERMVKNLPE